MGEAQDPDYYLSFFDRYGMGLGVLVKSFWYYKKLIANDKATPAEKSAVIWAILFLGKYMVLNACQHVLENHDKPVSRHTVSMFKQSLADQVRVISSLKGKKFFQSIIINVWTRPQIKYSHSKRAVGVNQELHYRKKSKPSDKINLEQSRITDMLGSLLYLQHCLRSHEIVKFELQAAATSLQASFVF